MKEEKENIAVALPEEPKKYKSQREIYGKKHDKIMECIAFYEKSSIYPTVEQMVDYTGISATTVYKHLKKLKKNPAYKAKNALLTLKAYKIKSNIYDDAMLGDKNSRNMVCKMEGWFNKNNSKTKSTVNNMKINRNNTLIINGSIITNDMFLKLSPEDQTKIIDSFKSLTKPSLHEPA
jgi:hypothetical protein